MVEVRWGRDRLGWHSEGLTRLKQLSDASCWQQSKLWLALSRPPLFVSTLRLSKISLNRSSSPDPRKLPSRVSSAQGLWVSLGLKVGLLD